MWAWLQWPDDCGVRGGWRACEWLGGCGRKGLFPTTGEGRGTVAPLRLWWCKGQGVKREGGVRDLEGAGGERAVRILCAELRSRRSACESIPFGGRTYGAEAYKGSRTAGHQGHLRPLSYSCSLLRVRQPLRCSGAFQGGPAIRNCLRSNIV